MKIYKISEASAYPMKHIHLKTKIPNKNDVQFYKKFGKYEAQAMHGQLPIVWNNAIGCHVYDRWGNMFLDFSSGIAVTNIGHGSENICEEIKIMIATPLLHTYTFPSVIRYEYLKELVEYVYPSGKAFLVSAGTEATEAAVKLMKMHGRKQSAEKRMIYSFQGAMHGRTILAEQLKCNTGTYWYNYNYDIYNMNFPKTEELFKPVHDPKYIAGFIIESYQGWSARFYPKKFIQSLVQFATKHCIPVCFDEIQGGFWRTGKMFAYEWYDVPKPDLLCLGKGISSSVPLSAVVGKPYLMDGPEIGAMSSTHSANPISCAAGLGCIKELKRLVPEEVKQKGDMLFNDLVKALVFPKQHKHVTEVNGNGLLIGVVTDTDEYATMVVKECFKRGLILIWTHRNSIKLAPPLTISVSALIEGLKVFKQVLRYTEDKI